MAEDSIEDQPVTESGFRVALARATNVRRKGGPPASQLSASTGIKLTHYGYANDSTPDSYSYYGIGDRGNVLTPGIDAALTQSEREARFGVTGSSTGKTFEYNGRTYRDSDTAPEHDRRVDVFDPHGSEGSDPLKAKVDKAGVNAYTITGIPYRGTKGPPSVSESAPRTAGAAAGRTAAGLTTTAKPVTEKPKTQEEAASQEEEKPKAKAVAQDEEGDQQPKAQQAAESHDEEQPGFNPAAVRISALTSGQMTPVQSAMLEQQEAAAKPIAAEDEPNPIAAKLLDAIYKQYGGGEETKEAA